MCEMDDGLGETLCWVNEQIETAMNFRLVMNANLKVLEELDTKLLGLKANVDAGLVHMITTLDALISGWSFLFDSATVSQGLESLKETQIHSFTVVNKSKYWLRIDAIRSYEKFLRKRLLYRPWSLLEQNSKLTHDLIVTYLFTLIPVVEQASFSLRQVY